MIFGWEQSGEIYLILEGDDARLHNFKGVVRHGLRDGVVVHLGAQIADYVREELPVGREGPALLTKEEECVTPTSVCPHGQVRAINRGDGIDTRMEHEESDPRLACL